MAAVDKMAPMSEPAHDPAHDLKNEKGSSNDSTMAAEAGQPIPVVPEEVEKRLIRKLDRRIIPVCCWIYLMNFMDRGE